MFFIISRTKPLSGNHITLKPSYPIIELLIHFLCGSNTFCSMKNWRPTQKLYNTSYFLKIIKTSKYNKFIVLFGKNVLAIKTFANIK